MNIDQYCQRQRCKHVEFEQFLACFRVARVCQRLLIFLVTFLAAMLRRAPYKLRLSVRNVEVSWSHRLEFFENNLTVSLLGVFALRIPNIRDLLQGEHPEILAGIKVEYGKSGFRRTKAVISPKCDKIALMLLSTSRKSHTRFRLVPKSTTSDNLEGSSSSSSSSLGGLTWPK